MRDAFGRRRRTGRLGGRNQKNTDDPEGKVSASKTSWQIHAFEGEHPSFNRKMEEVRNLIQWVCRVFFYTFPQLFPLIIPADCRTHTIRISHHLPEHWYPRRHSSCSRQKLITEENYHTSYQEYSRNCWGYLEEFMLVSLGAWQLFIVESFFGPPQNRVDFFSWPGSLEEVEVGRFQVGQCQPD